MDEQFVQAENIKISDNFTLKDVLRFKVDNRIIWGATAIILNELKAIFKNIEH